jgi:hypothetical protein
MIRYNMFDDTETQSNVYTAQDVAERMASFGDGVCGNDELKCSCTASQVTVSPGRAWIMGYFYESTENQILTAPATWYAIVLRLDLSAEIKIQPVIIQRQEDIKDTSTSRDLILALNNSGILKDVRLFINKSGAKDYDYFITTDKGSAEAQARADFVAETGTDMLNAIAMFLYSVSASSKEACTLLLDAVTFTGAAISPSNNIYWPKRNTDIIKGSGRATVLNFTNTYFDSSELGSATWENLTITFPIMGTTPSTYLSRPRPVLRNCWFNQRTGPNLHATGIYKGYEEFYFENCMLSYGEDDDTEERPYTSIYPIEFNSDSLGLYLNDYVKPGFYLFNRAVYGNRPSNDSGEAILSGWLYVLRLYNEFDGAVIRQIFIDGMTDPTATQSSEGRIFIRTKFGEKDWSAWKALDFKA